MKMICYLLLQSSILVTTVPNSVTFVSSLDWDALERGFLLLLVTLSRTHSWKVLEEPPNWDFTEVSFEYANLLLFTCNKYQGKEISVSGYGWCDSPGSSAKFCTYSLMEAESGTILHLERITNCQSWNVKAFNHISMNTACTIKELTIDASSSIVALLCKVNWYLVLT